MNSDNYFLPHGYTHNLAPTHYDDIDDGISWQCGVYDLAYSLAKDAGGIVDIGCGQARKLHRFKDLGVPIIGYDRKIALDAIPDAPWLDKRPLNLDADLKWGAPFPAKSVIICSDVIEHLLFPMAVITDLATFASAGHTVIISTPDRELSHGSKHNGPPPNKSHVREWSTWELVELVREMIPDAVKTNVKLEVKLTQTHDKSPEAHTITVILTRGTNES